MNIDYNEFEVLVNIEREGKKLSQRKLSLLTHFSLGKINTVLKSLDEKNLIDKDKCITSDGYKALEPYKVKRAVFLAAGFGSRMVPITFNTPKPLVRVKGKRIIETLLDAVKKAGIPEIYIVTGYLGEEFKLLLDKYPNIKLIHNSKYNESNNISSAYLVKDILDNSYVLESDLVLNNPNLIRKYEYHSNILGQYFDRSDDWCFETKNGIIKAEVVGGVNCYQEVGISYFDKESGIKLRKDIEDVFNEPGGKELFWEQVMLLKRKNNYQIHVRECYKDDIIEIDSFNELKQIDPTYDV